MAPEGGAGGRGRKLRVKLTGAATCTRDLQDSEVSTQPAEGAVAMDTSAPAPAAVAGAQFSEGAMVLLMNGSLCYEAQVVQVADTDMSKKGAPGFSYLVRYTKWLRRPEEWVGEAFVHPHTECAICPPRPTPCSPPTSRLPSTSPSTTSPNSTPRRR